MTQKQKCMQGIIGIIIPIIVCLFVGYWFDVQYGYGQVVGLLVAILFYLIIRDLIKEAIKVL